MSLFTDTTAKYSVLDLGFGLNLVKVGSQEVPQPEMVNVFTGGNPSRNILPGELISDILQKSGTLYNGKTAFDNTQTGYILGVDASDSLVKFYIGNTTNYLNWTGTALNIAGVFTASEIHIPNTTTANSFHTDSNGNSWWGATTLAAAPASITNAGAITGSSVTITGGSISSTPISSIPNNSSTDLSLLEFSHNIVFSVTDADTIAWAAGTIVMSNGRTFSIDAGNTGNMSALTYIYLDTGTSSTVLQTTTTYSTAMGANKVLLGMARNNTVTASFIPRGGGQPLIDGGNIGALSIIAGNIAASTITSDKISVSQLSAISADIGIITAGSISVVSGANTIGLTPSGTNAIFSGTTGSPEFKVTPAGLMTATSGTFGAWTISGNTFTTTANNILIGTSAGAAITTGVQNVLFGLRAGDALTEGINNVFISTDAGDALTTGSSNILIGVSAGSALTTGSSNTVLGNLATIGTTAASSVLLGASTGNGSLTGANNIVIGVSAGTALTTGADNILIGGDADVGSGALNAVIAMGRNATPTASNQMVIGGASYGINDVYIGESVTDATPLAVTLQNNGASGANVAGANFTIAAGKSTGSAAGGSLLFATSPAGGAGSSLNALVTALTIDSTGLFTFAGAGAMNFASKSMTNVNIDSGTINGITDLVVADGGTGLSTITALSIWLANSANVITELTPGAGKSLRINAGGTAWEAYTPSTGGTRLGTATTDVRVSSATGQETTTETNLISVSVPANTLSTANGVRVRLHIEDFDISNNAGQTLILRLKYGTTTIASATITRPGTSITNLKGYIEALLIASGATNSQEGSIVFYVSKDPGAGVDALIQRYIAAEGTAAEDSTGALNVIVSAQWAQEQGDTQIVMDHGIVEQIIS